MFDISLEKLVAADPEVIVLGDAAYGTTPDIVKARPGWGTMTAVKTGAIRPANDILVTRPGPRLVEGPARPCSRRSTRSLPRRFRSRLASVAMAISPAAALRRRDDGHPGRGPGRAAVAG